MVYRDKIVVFVGSVTDDIRFLEVPKLTVAALKFTETARAKITKAGGKCMTLDELVMKAPTGKFVIQSILPTLSIIFIIYKRVSRPSNSIKSKSNFWYTIGTNTLLLRASKDREAKKHFGRAPGLPGSRTKPWVRAKGRKFERCKAL